MARDGISKSQVFNAADAISAAGQAPTVASVRAKLGTGSYTTITAMLRDWKSQADTKTDDVETDVPEEVTEALGRAAGIVWKAAQDHFRHELATVKKEAERATAAAQAQTADALAEIARLEAEADERESHVDNCNSTIDKLRVEIEEGKSLRAELSATLKAGEARIKEQGELLRRLVPEKAKEGKKPVAVKPNAKPSRDELAGQA